MSEIIKIETDLNVMSFEMWRDNFKNAKKFFESKGNLNTRSRLKDKWHKDFYEKLNDLGNKVLELKKLKDANKQKEVSKVD